MEEEITVFDWTRVLLNNWDPKYLLEVIFRTVFIFLLMLTILRFAGKRGLKQLSIFELAIIIGLGTAAGDPMIYPDTPLIPAAINFILVISMYRLITWLTGKYKKAENLFEGKPICLFENGKINRQHLQVLGFDELFSELRVNHVSHLGQIEKIYLETSGEVTMYFYPDEEVKPGLPIQPEFYEKKFSTITVSQLYSCGFCGNTLTLTAGTQSKCSECNNEHWIASVNGLRIT